MTNEVVISFSNLSLGNAHSKVISVLAASRRAALRQNVPPWRPQIGRDFQPITGDTHDGYDEQEDQAGGCLTLSSPMSMLGEKVHVAPKRIH
jgi:hypothetical protein